MRKYILYFFFALCFHNSYAQDPKTLVAEGVDLHDLGKYDEAIKKYDEAISLDKNFYLAYYEKSLTLYTVKRYDECIELSKFILKNFKDGSENAGVYIHYGTCFDMQGKPKEAMEIYNEGIKKFPRKGLLYFNKAVTLVNTGETDDAVETIKLSISNSPYHASSHHVLSILSTPQNKILGLMSSLVFLAIEPDGKRAATHLENVKAILSGGAKKTGDNSVTINLDPSMLDKKEEKEDNFRSIELIMSMSAGLDFSEKNQNETVVDRLQRKLESMISMMGEKGSKKGFGWTHYAPFFVKLKQDKQLETLCHLAYSSADDAANNTWLTENKYKVEDFDTWLRSFWKKE